MRRRTYLTASLAAAVGLAGCEDALDETNQSDQPDEQSTEDGKEDDPRLELAEEFLFAVLRGDGEAAMETLHPESPLRDLDFENQEPEELEDVRIEESELLEEDEESATVRLVVQIVVDGSERTEELGLELRWSEGAWTVWDTVELPDDATAPFHRFRSQFRTTTPTGR
jgi:hypothetical protein